MQVKRPAFQTLPSLCAVVGLIVAGCSDPVAPYSKEQSPVADPQKVRSLASTVVDGKEIQWGSQSELWRSLDGPGDNNVLLFTGGDDLQGDVHTLASDQIPVHAGDVISFDAELRTEGGPAKPLGLLVQARINGVWEGLEPRVEGFATPDQTELPDWTYRKGSVIVPTGATECRAVATGHGSQSRDSSWQVRDYQIERVSLRDYSAQQRDAARLNDIILVGVDTLGQTPLSCYGNSPVATPNIDALAAEGRLYTEVTTAAPWTRPSFASIFTSLYPSQHKAEDFHIPLGEEALTLAEALKKRGYFTGAFVRTSSTGVLGSKMGLDQGFDFYVEYSDEAHVGEAAQAFFDANAAYLRAMGGGGLFIWQHAWEPHSPYINRRPEQLRNEDGIQNTVHISQPMLSKLGSNSWRLGEEYNEQDVDYIKRVYASEAAYVDGLVGNLSSRLKEVGLYESANIVVCADHGEAFGENGYWQHGNGYEPTVRTPLILRMPGRVAPGTVDRQSLVSNLDIMPTLLEVADAPIPKYLEGVSLISPEPDSTPRAYAFSEDRRHGWLTVRDSQYKLVAKNASRGEKDKEFGHLPVWLIGQEDSEIDYALYDLLNDPLEQEDRSDDAAYTAVSERLKARLEKHCAQMGIGAGGHEAATGLDLPGEIVRELEALGYLN